MVDIVGWQSYEYPRQEVYGEDYFDPCPSIMAEAEIENEKRRKRALKRVTLRSGTHIWEQCCEGKHYTLRTRCHVNYPEINF